MNYWTQLSIDFANRSNYLDELFRVYPIVHERIPRDINGELWEQVERAFQEKNNIALLKTLLKLDLFPIKDSYVAYLREDETAIERNPNTVNRLCGEFYEMGLDKIYKKCSEPKEANRRMGPLFKRWLNKGALGIQPVSPEDFLASDDNAILGVSDAQMKKFAREHLSYTRNKGLDFVARFNGKYVIGEAKFLTDFGGHQDRQFDDAMAVVQTEVNAVTVAILDGVLYIKSRSRRYRAMTEDLTQYNIMSSLVLREFLYQL